MKLTIEKIVPRFLGYLAGRGYREKTVKGYRYALNVFSRYLAIDKKENLHDADLREVETKDILNYRVYLTGELKKYKSSSANIMMHKLNIFFNYLVRHEHILRTPFDGITLPGKKGDTIRESMNEKELAKLIDDGESKDVTDERNRVLFEFLYGTGLRIGEASVLLLADVDIQSGRVLVKNGKGGKDRIVPIGGTLLEKLRRYVKHTRSRLLKTVGKKSDYMFFNRYGMRMSNSAIQRAFKRRVKQIGLDEKKYCPHMIRHSFATHMLEHGAGVKHVKEILGHKSIQTTVGYTHFSVSNLKRIVKMYHPCENEFYRELTGKESERFEEILQSK